ncbi:sec1 family domain-containing protein 2 isoform X1 [Anguilla rostrata]|uniref:sec1 family domain-containing protein 2 isoform X1 n=1 Tax=Anguilla rostrata TaxID=7938 RepID=UPI0030CF6BC1
MLTAEGVSAFSRQVWDKVLSKVKKAVVFMDDRCTECLHWNGAVASLLEAGARNLKQFSSFESGGENEPKAVFVVSTLLKGRTADVIRDIIRLSRFQYCVVFTAVPHSVHLLANDVSADLEGNPVFERFEEKLCEWMGNMNFTAEVMHAPVVLAPVAPQLVLLPAFGDLFPLLTDDLETINRKRPEKKRLGSLVDLDMHCLPQELQIQIKTLASGLNAMFEFANVREESFALGPLSRIIAGELANHAQSKARRKNAPNKASVVFIDRTLDLTGDGPVTVCSTGAVGHHGDSLVEKILSVLPPLPGHRCDVQVDMLELTDLPHTPETQGTLAPGCLAQPQDRAACALWEAMLSGRQKEAVMEVRRHLVEAASKENLPIKMSMGRVTADQLLAHVRLFRGHWEALESHCGVLQLSLATAQTLRHPHLPLWDTCLASERLLLQTFGDSDLPAVLKQIQSLVKGGAEGGARWGLDELLVLLVYVYSVAREAGPEEEGARPEEERAELEMMGALTLLLTQQTQLSPLVQRLTGCVSVGELTAETAHTTVERVFRTLRGLGHARRHLKHLRSTYSPGDGVHQATYRPLLKLVLEEIFHPDRRDCPDIEHMSAGLTDLLKTGFSMFMKVSRPHPSDHAPLLLFLVGGVTPSELRLVRETVSAHKPSTQVLVLSTRLLSPKDVPELLFGTERLFPDIGV